MEKATEIQIDIACTVARIEQALALPIDNALRELLLHRLLTCDVPRLRGHLGHRLLDELTRED